MKKAFSSAHVVLALALSGSVGIGAALAAHAATSGRDQAPAGTAVRQIDPGVDQMTATATTTPTQSTGRDPAVGLTEAARIAALIGGGRVTESDEESTPTGITYELRIVRADGTARDLVVDGRDGRVLANRVHGQSDALGGAAPDGDHGDHSSDASDHGDHSSDASDHGDHSDHSDG
jgi:uncharacterized membrane protein YkoI